MGSPDMDLAEFRENVKGKIDDLEKSIIVVQAIKGERRPLAELHDIARSCEEMELMLIGVLIHPDCTDEDQVIVAQAFGRLMEIDFYGHSFNDLVELAEAAENN